MVTLSESQIYLQNLEKLVIPHTLVKIKRKLSLGPSNTNMTVSTKNGKAQVQRALL